MRRLKSDHLIKEEIHGEYEERFVVRLKGFLKHSRSKALIFDKH